MIFQYTLEQVLSQRKTQTRRVIRKGELAIRGRYNRIVAVQSNNRTKWQVGKTYAVQPGRGKSQVARICLERINSEYVTRISTADALAEGFKNRQDFLETWCQIHGTDALGVRVWVLTFKTVGYYADMTYYTYSEWDASQYALR